MRVGRGFALLAVLVLIVLGGVVVVATISMAERSVMAERSAGQGVDRLLRVRSAFVLAQLELAGQREAVLGGATPTLGSRSLGMLGDGDARARWLGADASRRRSAEVALEGAADALAGLGGLRGGGGGGGDGLDGGGLPVSWEPEIAAVGPRLERTSIADALAEASGEVRSLVASMSAIASSGSRSEAARVMRSAGIDAAVIARLLDRARFGETVLVADRVDINRCDADALVELGIGADDADAIVRGRERRSEDERASVYWPVAAGVIDDADAFVGALDRCTTRTMQWRLRVGVGGADRSSENGGPAVVYEGLIDLSGERPRWIAVGRAVSVAAVAVAGDDVEDGSLRGAVSGVQVEAERAVDDVLDVGSSLEETDVDGEVPAGAFGRWGRVLP